MPFLKVIKKMKHIDGLIRAKATGHQQSFAKKLGVSRSMLNKYLRQMKELGFPICYSRQRQTYYYREHGKIVEKIFQSDGIKH